jgi:LPS-assembly lipoprotein
MLPRLLPIILCLALLFPLSGCGWTPLYADPESGPATAELRAIRVAPISERIGQKLELALRTWLNPGGEPTPQRFVLHTTLSVVRLDLGINTQGLGTRARLEVHAAYVLNDIKTGVPLLSGNLHVTQSFDIVANQYSNIVAEEDARDRAVKELLHELVTRLELFMQSRAPARPVAP